MPKTTRDQGGTIAGVPQNPAIEPILIGKRMILRDGRVEFLNSAGVVDAVLFRDSAGVLRLTGALHLQGAAAGDDMLTVRVDGNTQPQLVVNANGRIEFGSGSGAVDVALFRDGSTRLHTINTFVTEGDLVCDVAGGGVNVKEGANARMGTATLVAGAATVATTEVTANSRVLLTSQADGGAPGFLRVSARTPATSFVITSSSATDTSTVAWLIVEPA